MIRVHKGDTVVIIAGKDRGKRGTIERVLREAGRVVVSGVNIMKRHVKPNKQYPSGGIVEIAYPLHVSNVMVVNPDTDTPSRTSTRVEGKTKSRVFKIKRTSVTAKSSKKETS